MQTNLIPEVKPYRTQEEAKTGLQKAFVPTSASGVFTPEQQKAIDFAASQFPKAQIPPPTEQPKVAPTPTEQPKAATPTPTPTPTFTPTPAKSYEEEQLIKSQADYQTQSQAVQDKITNIQNGVIPLTASEQAMVDGLKQQFEQLIADQKLTNTGASGTANIRGYQTGAAEYDPTFQVKTIGSIFSAGQKKVADLAAQEAAAVAQLTEGIKSKNIEATKSAWSMYESAAKTRQEGLKETIEKTQQAIKDAQKAQQEAQDKIDRDQKVFYEQVTKPIQNIAAQVLANTGNAKLAASISQSEDMTTAMELAGDALQTATGEQGAYLFAKRQIQSNGGIPPSYETWKTTLEKQALDRKLAEMKATEGLKFNYSIALAKAKEDIAKMPQPGTPAYDGKFEATIKLASQAGGTNVQRAQIKSDLQDFISSGDYKSAYTQIIDSTRNKLKGLPSTNFQKGIEMNDSLTKAREILKDLEKNGVNTNIFKITQDKLGTNVGVLTTDPRYATAATMLTDIFQQYRQNMTGAAFSPAESAEYGSVLPSAGNTMALNMAKIDGTKQYLNSNINSAIKSTVGEGGIYIREYAEAGDEIQNKQQNLTQNIANFRAISTENDEMVKELASTGLSAEEIAEQLGL